MPNWPFVETTTLKRVFAPLDRPAEAIPRFIVKERSGFNEYSGRVFDREKNEFVETSHPLGPAMAAAILNRRIILP